MNIRLIVHTMIVDDLGRILIIRRSGDDETLPGFWDIPGGSLEDAEDPAIGAIREAKEETGLNIVDPVLCEYSMDIDHDKQTQFIRLIFRTRFQGGSIILNPADHDAFSWVDPTKPDQQPLVEYLETIFRRQK